MPLHTTPLHKDRSHLYLGIAPYSAIRPPLNWFTSKIQPSRNLLGDYLMYSPSHTSGATLPSDGSTHRKQDRRDRLLYDDTFDDDY